MKTVTKKLKNKKMDSEVYKLRRKVINVIYEIKEQFNIPRITVRIADRHDVILGVARLKDNIIWITEESITDPRYDLRTLVMHELLHAIYGIGHDKKCPLMKPKHTPLTKAECYLNFSLNINSLRLRVKD